MKAVKTTLSSETNTKQSPTWVFAIAQSHLFTPMGDEATVNNSQ